MNLDTLKSFIPKSITLKLDAAKMNALLQEAIAGQQNITQASIVCEDGSLQLSASLLLAGTRMVYTTRLGLNDITLTPDQRIISFRRLEPDNLSGSGPVSMLMAWFIKAIVCGLFGLDIAASSLSSLDGLVIEKNRVTADLDKLGLTARIQQAAAEKTAALVKEQAELRLPDGFKGIAARLALQAALPTLMQKASALALQRIQVTNLRITAAEGLTGDLMLAKTENEPVEDQPMSSSTA